MVSALGTDRRVQFALGCWLLGCVIALGEKPAAGLPNELWPPLGVGFIVLTLVWDGRGRPGRAAAATTVLMALSFWMVGILLGYPAFEVATMAVLNTSASWVMVVLYAFVKDSPGWAPRGARSLATLAGAAVVASTFVTVLGGFPGQSVGELEVLTLWWVIRSTIFAFVGGATFMIFYFGDREFWRTFPRPSRVGLGLLVPVSFACMYVVFLGPDLPLSWFLLIPAVWAGVMLTPYGASVHALMQALAAGVLALTAADKFTYEGVLPTSLIIDMLLTASTFVALQIALLRDERERAMIAERVQRQAADAQSTLLGQVFDSMTDGMLLFSGDGALVRYNPAARHLLGRPLPARAPGGWVAYLGLSDTNGEPIDDLEFSGAPGRRHSQSTVAIDHAEDRRLLEIGSWPISETDSLVLVTDVTNQRHRMAELSRFAGIVSHDLRTPLTSLHGWLEMASEAAANGRTEAIGPLLRRAESSSRRMERVIGGWINYTVVREGNLTPERVVLAEVISDVIGATNDAAGEPGPWIEVTAPHAVRADPALTRQLLANLVGNSVKFARPGAPAQIEISSREDDEHGWIRIEVADHGLGLPAGQEDRVFEEFHRAPEHAEIVEGTGLGLSLCRKIVTRHSGSIAAYTNEHGGATITLTLPAAREFVRRSRP
jgi:signal transduction histidine kinase